MKSPILYLAGSYLKDPLHWVQNIAWRLPRTVSEMDCVFVVGAPRSGTTLLQRILTVHSKFFSIDAETGMFSAQNIFSRRHFGLSEKDLAELFAASRDIVDFFDRAVARLARGEDGTRFVEKTPLHVFHLPFILKRFPRAQVLNVVRDGRDCYCSSLKHPGIPQNRSVVSFARYWDKCIQSGNMPADCVTVRTVRYEDLTARPAEVIGGIMTWLGHEFEEDQVRPEVLGRDPRSDVDRHRRVKTPIDISSVNRWRRELPDEDVRTFEHIAGESLRLHGYEVS